MGKVKVNYKLKEDKTLVYIHNDWIHHDFDSLQQKEKEVGAKMAELEKAWQAEKEKSTPALEKWRKFWTADDSEKCSAESKSAKEAYL